MKTKSRSQKKKRNDKKGKKKITRPHQRPYYPGTTTLNYVIDKASIHQTHVLLENVAYLKKVAL